MSIVQHTASNDGTRIGYRVSGAGERLLLVHGAATSSADWLFAMPFLEERFSVVTMDRRGRGESGDAGEYSIEREAEDILTVLDEVGAEILVGHSYGALCSVEAAGRTDRLRSLVLYEPPIGVRAEQVVPLADRVSAGELDTALAGFLRAAGTRPDELELIRSSAAWPMLLDAMPMVPRELGAAARWERPRSPIDVPTLFVLGGETRSGAYLDGLDDLLALFPDLERATLPGQQHVGHVFDAERFAALVTDFVSAHPARTSNT